MWNKTPPTKPPFYGEYLVIHKSGPVCYRQVLVWTPGGWSNPQEELYGRIVAWTELPKLPSWL